MDIKEFFELSAGKWFSQKTSHHLTLKQSANGKSNLVIELLANDDPHVIKLCQQAQIDPSLICGGAKYTWNTIPDALQPNQGSQQGSEIVISIPSQPGASTGSLYRTIGCASTNSMMARYMMGEDNALNIVIEQELVKTEDRIWFESNNFRLRTTIVTPKNGDPVANFYTEIRLNG